MVRHSNPFAGRYTRYILSILIFGLLLPFLLWQTDPLFSLLSILAALLLTVGVDYILSQVAQYKAEAMVSEPVRLVFPAFKRTTGAKGFFVMTDRFTMFVPLWHKITLVLENERIMRYEIDNYEVDLIVKFPNKHRSFYFTVSSPHRVQERLESVVGPSLPYKYDKSENATK
ncbi:hypothetical protein [Salisediminibacterium halotolerans]|uniref:hypothetical protein n=1 Tax=Salisediminibacterium halotolerans TaxID=517425 RepID=UPI000EB13BA5|nr:hypothetical protein [Salisediminibacterium halotolerans]RLJ69665.1 hypothetical protein BCL39_2529 [Actinophytocola xinjiangensis]RPE89723.1 hypothetical protein EDD67_0500 [Salisediminibacterium halotolerans]TWG32559.1 hypothetical protein BCL52_2524 [Salisediminibacterium halotolerans]GEL08450.1 hypothetical protein SHA02_18660 [Salisediminibacterium halotolerans]